MPKVHRWSDYENGFRATPYMQSLILYAGQSDNYLLAQTTLETYLRVAANDSSINRICFNYGMQLEEESVELEGLSVERAEQLSSELKADEVVYVMADGCLLLTREEDSSWREMKLGRVFKSNDHLQLGEKPNVIKQSIYVSHFGHHQTFTDKLELVVDSFESLGTDLVFINDGASWINNWIVESYPNATNILDFYHAAEYLHDFAKVMWKDEEKRQDWVSRQRWSMLNDQIVQVIQDIDAQNVKGKTKQAAKNKILTYYRNNQHRMYYKTYRNRGLLIGSGPIESAHRFVLQKRLKQSGQKWTRQGGQAIANLRTAYLNGQWENVVELIQKKAA